MTNQRPVLRSRDLTLTNQRPALPGDLQVEVTLMRTKMINLDNLNTHKLKCGSILASAKVRLLGPSLTSSAVRDSKLIHGIIDHILRLECVSWNIRVMIFSNVVFPGP